MEIRNTRVIEMRKYLTNVRKIKYIKVKYSPFHPHDGAGNRVFYFIFKQRNTVSLHSLEKGHSIFSSAAEDEKVSK